MFCTFTSALPSVCVQWPIWLFFLHFLNFVLSRYVAQVLSESFSDGSSRPAITGITFAFTFHMLWIYIVWYLHFKIFSACFLTTFLSAGIATSIDTHVPCLSSCIVMSGLMLRYFCRLALFVPQYGNLNFSTSLYQFLYKAIQLFAVQCSPISLHMLQCSSAHTVSCLCMYCYFPTIVHADMMCSTVSSNCLQSTFSLCFSL